MLQGGTGSDKRAQPYDRVSLVRMNLHEPLHVGNSQGGSRNACRARIIFAGGRGDAQSLPDMAPLSPRLALGERVPLVTGESHVEVGGSNCARGPSVTELRVESAA